jgi:hypothetical protein
MLQRSGVELGTGIELEHDAILIELGEDGGDLALAERIVKRVVDRLRRHPETRRGVAVDVQRRAGRRGL